MQKWNIKWHLKAGLVAALLAISSSAQAGPLASAKALGMGGAAVAFGQDSLTAFYNPATAGSVDTRYDLEFDTRWTNKELHIGDRGPAFIAPAPTGVFRTNHHWDFYGEGGFNYRFGCYNEWAFGVQWNNYDQINTHYRDPLTDFSGTIGGVPDGPNLVFDYRADALTFTGAYNWDENHTFGVGVNVYFSWLKNQGLDFYEDLFLTTDPGDFTGRGRDEATGVGVTLGYLGHFFCDQLAVGFAWSPKVHMGRFSRYSGFLAQGRIDIPETYRAGLAYNWDCATTVAADYEFRRYSRVRSLANPFPSDGADFGPVFGSTSGPGFGWSDQSIVKLGVNCQLDCALTGRFGYRWEQSPIRRQTTATALNVLTHRVIQHYLTFGLTYNWDACTEISYFSEYGFEGNRTSFLPEIAGGVEGVSGKLHLESNSYATGISWGQTF